jgi:DNA-binding transcriptional MerR regulator
MANVDRVAYTTERTASSERLLSIGEFARRSRLSAKALRLYERRRLLVPAAVDESNGYRRYRESQLATARLIATLRRIDMPLSQVAEVVAAPEPRAGELVAAYWASIERRIAGQRELASHLQIRLSGAEGSYDMFEIQQRDVAEQLVLTEQRHIRARELPAWMGAAFGRLHTSAERFGGVTGPALAIFHGEVNEDSDGPVEVCVPIDPGLEPGKDVAARTEPAHREAFVRIRKAMVEYPQILTAYDAVERWVTANGIAIAGSPREVYFTDFMAAGPDDEVCDIAFPIA